MPLAYIACQQCSRTFEGDVPDGKAGGHYEIKGPLRNDLQRHHIETRILIDDLQQNVGIHISNEESILIHGHDFFDVFIMEETSGSRGGLIYVTSYEAGYQPQNLSNNEEGSHHIERF